MTSLMKHILRAGLVVVLIGLAATPARADWLLTPYLGGVFGGDANAFKFNDLDDEFEQRVTYGASLAWMGKGIVGMEVDYSVAPNFFQFTGGSADFNIADFDASVQSLMGNLIIGAPIGGSGKGLRPYLSGGVGLLRTNVDSGRDLFKNLSTNELGLNAGAGVHAFFSDRVGLRADVRYFRGLEQKTDDDPAPDDDLFDEDFGLSNFKFWRGTLGVTFRF